MLISPFTPLFFTDRKTDGIESDYVQTFSTADRILVEVFIGDEDEGDWNLYREPGHELFDIVNYKEWRMNADTTLHFSELSLSPGCYSLEIGGKRSHIFHVTDDERELRDTTLIQYSHGNNRQRTDVVFLIDNMQYFFAFRVPGGFKDSGWSFGVEGEQFITPSGDISQLYGLESTQKTFTLGNSDGCPIWFGEMLNRILVCSHVYFDGVKYSRKDSSVPEVTQVLEGVNSFVFSQTLQQSVNLDPVIEERNHLITRYILPEQGEYRKISDSLFRKV